MSTLDRFDSSMVESPGPPCHHSTISSHPYGKDSSGVTVLIRGNRVLGKAATTHLLKQSSIQAHDDHRRIDKELVLKKNRRGPSSLPVSERDSVRKDPLEPNTMEEAMQAITTATGNQSNADLVIQSRVSASRLLEINRHQFPACDSPSTSPSNSENFQHRNIDPEQHVSYVAANGLGRRLM